MKGQSDSSRPRKVTLGMFGSTKQRGVGIVLAAALMLAAKPTLASEQNAQTSNRFDIPGGSAYICVNKNATDMLMSLMYSRTSDELASVIFNAQTQQIEMVPTWLFSGFKKARSANAFNYRNTEIASSILTILPSEARVLISGESASMKFVNCMMVQNKK